MSAHLSLTGLLPCAKKSSRKPALEHRQHNHQQMRMGGRQQQPIAASSCGTSSTNPRGAAAAAVIGIRAITNKAPLTIRPFAAIYNPYSKGCSVLCNHPATPELKTVVKHAKQSWKHESGNPERQQHHLGLSGRLTRVVSTPGEGKYYDETKHGGPRKLIKIMECDDVNQQQPPQQSRRRHHFDYDDLPVEHGVVPEEFLRRFTDTDSRPMTPTPTVLSNKTYSSSVVRHSRRCVTPEPQNMYESEKKRLILDLRRSHSQETLYWNASSEFSASVKQIEPSGGKSGSCHRPKAANMTREVVMVGGKTRIIKRNESLSATGGDRTTGSSFAPHVVPGSGGGTFKSPSRGLSANTPAETAAMGLTGEVGDHEMQRNQMQKQLSCIYSKDDLDEEPRRRGKKKKPVKAIPGTSTTFRPSQDPETQVAAVPTDSQAQSQRPSIVDRTAALVGGQERVAKRESKASSDFREALNRMSFLDESLLSQLRRGLSIKAIEMNFQLMMQRALKEAFKGMPFDTKSASAAGGGAGGTSTRDNSGRVVRDGGGGGTSPLSTTRGGGNMTEAHEAVENVVEVLNLPQINQDKWLTLPRKYSRMVSRFELPIDSTELSRLTPMQYLSKYVQVSNYRKQLYHRIFVQYLPDIRLDEIGEINWADSSQRPTKPPFRTAPTDNLSVSELYISQRVIPVAQLRSALSQTIICPSASSEMIEKVLELVMTTSSDSAILSEATGSINERDEQNAPRAGARSARISDNSMSTISFLSATDCVPLGNVLRINRDDDGCNGKLNVFTNRSSSSSRSPVEKDRKMDKKGDDSDYGETSKDVPDNAQISFAETAARIMANSPSRGGAQFDICDVVIAAQKMRGLANGFSAQQEPRNRSATGEEIVADRADEFPSDEIKITFRTWCGIVAFAERFTTDIQKENDTRHEIELIDFESLDRRINGLLIHSNLKEMLYIIKN